MIITLVEQDGEARLLVDTQGGPAPSPERLAAILSKQVVNLLKKHDGGPRIVISKMNDGHQDPAA